MKRRYFARRAFNATLDGVRMACGLVREWGDSDDSVLCVCSAVVRILMPVIGTLLVALMLSVIL